MTNEEYTHKIKEIERKANREKRLLKVAFAQEKARFKVGDIIRSGGVTIKINEVYASAFTLIPEPVYFGVELTKKLSPLKSGIINSIYECDSIELINK